MKRNDQITELIGAKVVAAQTGLAVLLRLHWTARAITLNTLGMHPRRLFRIVENQLAPRDRKYCSPSQTVQLFYPSKTNYINMKSIFLALLLVSACLGFETFQEMMQYDPNEIDTTNCPVDQQFVDTIVAYDSWYSLLFDHQSEVEEDRDLLAEARQKIQLAKDSFGDEEDVLPPEVPEATAEVPPPPQPPQPQQEQEQPPADPIPAPEPAPSGDGDDDPFGWGDGEVPQLLHKSHKFKSKHTAAFAQVVRNINAERMKSQAKKVIALAESLEKATTRNRKVEICDLILEELDQMLEQLDKLLNDSEYQLEVEDHILKSKQAVLDKGHECNAHIVLPYEVSFVAEKSKEKQISHKVHKSKHHTKEVSFLQINQQFEEDVAQYRVEQQKQILQSQGMLGFLHNSGKRVQIVRMD